ncbi:hypothetical protein D0Z07_7096 [Hyphodiscus hymeniophilus]|uniref:SGNH hydrolase-type esterase domain-containing protein n=1 Tax=Hyphodiscus hymeniophilus TaxID=353542 RepID=A0A9P6VG51_9HELO|nr:hypothetical protein D0Z07_7096 [Hyphodiscus hymeniophilus]
MMISRLLRWRSIATKTALFIATVVVLRLAFTRAANHSHFLSQNAALIKSYPSVPADIKVRPGAISMMVVGDSLSQGFEGDHTWRYRLWEWFNSQRLAVDFVGPFMGTRPQAVPGTIGEVTIPEPLGLPPTGSAITTGGYAVDIGLDFNPRHFSAAGRAIWNVPELISAMVKRYDPDYLLVLLGYNDLAWHFQTKDGNEVLSTMEEVLMQARAAKPNLKFAIGDVPQRMPIFEDLPNRTDYYNKLLSEAIPRWSTETSPVELVHMRELYRCENDKCPAAFDGLHPSALGEYQIAQAFSRALVRGFTLGATELAVPAYIPPRPSSIPRNLRAVAGLDGINVTWSAVYGAKEYEVQSRLVGEQNWTLWPSIQESRFHTPWVNGKLVEMEYKTTPEISGGHVHHT